MSSYCLTDEMVKQCHQRNEHELAQTAGDTGARDGYGPRGHENLDMA